MAKLNFKVTVIAFFMIAVFGKPAWAIDEEKLIASA